MPLGIISGPVNAGVNFANAIVSNNQFYDDKRHELYINELNWERTKLLNKWNRQYEIEDRNYLAQREDTAIQRRMADLKTAGINPILAGGQGGSAQAGMAPARNTSSYTPATYTPGRYTPIGNFPEFGDPLERMLAHREKLAQIENIEADTAAKKEGTTGTKHENTKKEIENKYREEQIRMDIEKTTKGNALTKQQTENLIQTHMINASQEQRNKAMFEIDKAGKQLDNELKKLDKEIEELEKQGITEENAREAEKFEMMKEERWLFYVDSITSSLSKIAEVGNKVKSFFNRGHKEKRKGRNP